MLEYKKTEVTVNSLLAAVLDFAEHDLVEKRVKYNVPEMNWQKTPRKDGNESVSELDRAEAT